MSKLLEQLGITKQTIGSVKKGEFVRLSPNAKNPKTYVNRGYCRNNNSYEIQNYDDISDVKYIHKGREVYTGFDF